MRRLIVFFVFVFVALSVGAVDVIITKDNRIIKGEVVEISDTEVKYKPEGNSVLFSTLKQNLNTIVMGSGEVFNFASQIVEDSLTVQLDTPADTQSFFMRAVKKGAVSHFYCGDRKISRREYEKITLNSCPDAYQMYKDGRGLRRSSRVLLGVGAGTLLSGVIVGVAFSGFDKKVYSYSIPISLTMIGAIEMCASSAMKARGRKMEFESMDLFNSQCLKKTEQSVVPSVVMSDLGLGFALRF